MKSLKTLDNSQIIRKHVETGTSLVFNANTSLQLILIKRFNPKRSVTGFLL